MLMVEEVERDFTARELLFLWEPQIRRAFGTSRARMLQKKKIPHNVLNAKYHEQEASIIAQAGRKGAVTISTNMAG